MIGINLLQIYVLFNGEQPHRIGFFYGVEVFEYRVIAFTVPKIVEQDLQFIIVVAG